MGGKLLVGVVFKGDIPRTHCQAHNSTDVASSADIEISRQESGHVRARGNGVRGDVGTELGQGECRSDDEDTKAGGAVRPVQEVAEELQRVPDWVAAIDDGGGR